MKRYVMSGRLIPPAYRRGDIVYEGDAHGYQCTSLIKGDINKFPESLAKYVHRIYYVGDDTYRVEWLTDADTLFEEDYQNFFNKISPILEANGFRDLD